MDKGCGQQCDAFFGPGLPVVEKMQTDKVKGGDRSDSKLRVPDKDAIRRRELEVRRGYTTLLELWRTESSEMHFAA